VPYLAADREFPPTDAGERETLTSWLEWQRATLGAKCEGLAPEELRQRSAPPSTLSLLGLVRHMAEVERNWFRRGLAAEEIGFRWITDESPDAEFDEVDGADVEEAISAWHEEMQIARAIAEAAPTLEESFERDDRRYSLRWVLVHMIEEYARHNGHADLLRERIDGAVGY
jgi:uncharacterized damage-inducible protein DinB